MAGDAVYTFGFKAAAVGMLSGHLAAFVVTAIGGRIVMRIIAIADPSTQTEFTGGGTMTIAAFGFVGVGVVGALGGLLFVAVRRFLPGSWVQKGVVFSVLWLVVAGWLFFLPIQFESFSDFDPPVLAMGLFAGLYFLYGVALAGLVKLLHREVSGLQQA